MSVGSIYFYFKNKEEIYSAVYEGILEDIVQSTDVVVEEESDIKEIVEKSIRGFVSYMATHEHAVRFLVKNSYSVNMNLQRDDVFQASSIKMKKQFDEWIAKGKIKPINTDLASMAWMGSTYHVIRSWNFTDKTMDVDEVTRFLTEFNLRGLGIQ